MQILASALPGFRDLRAPLIAGYLWLMFLWILIKPDIHKRPINGVAAAVYDLAKDAGPIWIGLGVGVAAYLIGSVSQALSPVIGDRKLPLIAEMAWDRIPRLGRSRLVPLREMDLIGQYLDEAMQKISALGPERISVDDPFALVEGRERRASRGLDEELELPATLLLTEPGREPDPQLFSEADRLKAERELRLAVVPPLCAIVIFLAWNQSCWWWIALIPVAILLWQAHSKNSAFRSLMIGALGRGLARSQSVEDFRKWVEKLPESLSDDEPFVIWRHRPVDGPDSSHTVQPDENGTTSEPAH